MKWTDKTGQTELKLLLYEARDPEELAVPDGMSEAVRRAILATLGYEKFTREAEISLTFCNGPYIRTLNAEYRDKDSETDVLSFPLFDEDEEEVIEGAPVPLGDIVINLDRAVEQGETLGHSPAREAAFLAIHSTLHLLGYDHERSEADDEDMCRRQREILATLPDIL